MYNYPENHHIGQNTNYDTIRAARMLMDAYMNVSEVAVVRGPTGHVQNVLVARGSAPRVWHDVLAATPLKRTKVIRIGGLGCKPMESDDEYECDEATSKIIGRITAIAASCPRLVRDNKFTRSIMSKVVGHLNSDPNLHVLLLGHSYGGAAAVFVAQMIYEQQKHLLDRLHVATMGSIYTPQIPNFDLHHYMAVGDTACMCNGLIRPASRSSRSSRSDVTWVKYALGNSKTSFIARHRCIHDFAYLEIMNNLQQQGSTRVIPDSACIMPPIDTWGDIEKACDNRPHHPGIVSSGTTLAGR